VRVYVSVDFEGLPGISSVAQLLPRSPQYGDGREIATRVIDAVVSELKEVGASDILVADSHGYMANLVPWKVDARLLQGYPRPISMVLGVEGYDALMLIGYHAGAGTVEGFLDHTYSGATFQRVRVNGEPASEYLLNALIAGDKGVPVILVAGDEKLQQQVEKFTPWAVFIPLKRGVARYAAVSEPLSVAIKKLRDGVREAVSRLRRGDVRPLTLRKPYRVEIETRNPGVVDLVSRLAGVERLDAYTVAVEVDRMEDAMLLIQLIALVNAGLSSIIQQLR
jgi:D-amino peptidase